MTDRERFEDWLEKDEGVVRFNMELTAEYIASSWAVWQAATLAEREWCAEIAENYMVIPTLEGRAIAIKIRGE